MDKLQNKVKNPNETTYVFDSKTQEDYMIIDGERKDC